MKSRSAFAVLLFIIGTSPVLAQSGVRTGAPVQTYQQPAYQQGQVISQGSTIRSGTPIAQPVQRSNTRGQIIQGLPNAQPIYNTNVQGTLGQALPTVASTFESRFWDFLIRARYRNWAPVPGKSDGAYEGQSPHGAYLKMYLNRTAAGSPKDLPVGSIVIKENYGPDQKTLMAITAMYRTKSYNVAGRNWYWVKYTPNGEVDVKQSPTGSVPLAGKVKGCMDCHEGSDGGDYAFFNDDM